MRRVFINLSFLVALAAGATSLPRWVGTLERPAPGHAAGPDLTALAEFEAAANSGQAVSDDALKVLEARVDRALDAMTSEERERAKTSFPTLERGGNPITQRLQAFSRLREGDRLSSAFGVSRGFEVPLKAADWAAFFERNQFTVVAVFWGVPAVLVLVMIVAFLIGQHAAARAAGHAAFGVSSWALWTLSCLAVVLHVGFDVDFLRAAPWDFWAAPSLFMILAGWLMTMVDMNYPFWNRLVTSLLTPVLAATLVFSWDRIAAGFDSYLESFVSGG